MKNSFQCHVYRITKVKLLAWWKTFFGCILPSYITLQKHYKLSIHTASLLEVYVPIFKSSIIQICKIQFHLEKSLKQSNIIVTHCCSVVKSCPNFCDHMDCSTPSSSVFHYLLGFPQTHMHCADDVI